MIRKKAFFHSLLILLLFSAPAFAQKSEADKDPLELFRMGQELYNANHFAAAQKVFRDYLATNDNRYELRAEAEYYIATSAMELFQNDAEALLTQFTQNYPEHPKARLVNYSMGKFQFREKKYDKVVAAFKNVDESDLSQKERYEFYFMNGYANYRSGDKAEAKEYLAKAKDAENENKTMATLYYGIISYEEGNYKEALSEFLKIKDDKKAKAFVPIYVTQIYLLQGKYDKVIEFGEQALNATDEDGKPAANDKSRADVLRYVAEAYFMTKNYQKAAERYDALAKGGYNLSDQQYYQLGYAQYLSEDYAGAISSFNKINIKEDTLGQNVAYHLAGAYVKTGDLMKARNSYNFASKLKFLPKLQENALLNYAKLSYEQNYQTEAIDAFKSFINKYPKSPDATEANELLSQILLAADNPKEALEVLKGLPSRTGKLAEAYQKVLYLYGLELFKNKEYDESEDYFNQSLEHAVDRKTKALAYFWLGEAQYRQNETKDALGNYKNFLYVSEAKQTPYYAVAYYNLGYCYFKDEDYTQAKNYFNQYLNAESHDESPRATDAVLRAADCNFALKSYTAAQTGYDQIIRKNASEADYAYYQKGIIQGLQGNADGKISTMRSLASTFKKSAYIDDALYSVGETYMNNGNWTQAIKEFQALNRDYPKNPYLIVGQLNIGQSYINMGQPDKGVYILKKIVSTYPATAEAKTAMRFIQNSYTERGLTDSLAAFYAEPIAKNLIPNSQDSVLYTSAFNNVKRNDCPATITSMQKYLSKYPNGYFAVDASYYLAECYYKNPSPAKAQQYYNFVIARSPNQYMEGSLANSAELYYNDKDYTMAAKRYEQLEEIASKKDLTIYALQGELTSNFNLNDYQKTLDIGNKILGLGYTDEGLKTTAQYYMGKSYLALNQEENAMASFTQVMKTNDAEIGAESNYEVAHIYFLQEKYEDSRKSILALKDKYDGYDYWRAKAFILLADIYVKDGDTFQAKSTLQSIIDNYDGKDEIVETAKAKLQEIKANETGK